MKSFNHDVPLHIKVQSWNENTSDIELGSNNKLHLCDATHIC